MTFLWYHVKRLSAKNGHGFDPSQFTDHWILSSEVIWKRLKRHNEENCIICKVASRIFAMFVGFDLKTFEEYIFLKEND